MDAEAAYADRAPHLRTIQPSIMWGLSPARLCSPHEISQEPLRDQFRSVHPDRGEFDLASVIDDDRTGHHPIRAAVSGAVDNGFYGIQGFVSRRAHAGNSARKDFNVTNRGNSVNGR